MGVSYFATDKEVCDACPRSEALMQECLIKGEPKTCKCTASKFNCWPVIKKEEELK